MTVTEREQSQRRKKLRQRRAAVASTGDICIIGHPSHLGGADTELDHQVHVWQALGRTVHICHTGDLDDNLRAMNMHKRGCIYHKPKDWKSLTDLHCIGFCNKEFLEALPEIKKYARSSVFVNCMTWNFPKELEMQEKGLIDFHLYQTDHAMERVSKGLEGMGDYRPLRFRPYFHTADFPFRGERQHDRFRFGRISRGDADKFGSAQIWIYETMTAPVFKDGWILGWDKRAEKKFGSRPPDYIQVFPEGAIEQKQFYYFAEAVIMTTETFENLPRVGFEAMASGSLLVVDRKGGWEVLVKDGKTGWLCSDQREFVYKASRTAFEQNESDDMRHAARECLEMEWGLAASARSWAQVFKELDEL